MQERVHSTMRFVQRCFTMPFFICLASLFAVASTTKVEQYSSVNKHNGKGWAVESTSSVQAVRDLIERVRQELQIILKLNYLMGIMEIRNFQ